jgi:hypothetical protein
MFRDSECRQIDGGDRVSLFVGDKSVTGEAVSTLFPARGQDSGESGSNAGAAGNHRFKAIIEPGSAAALPDAETD